MPLPSSVAFGPGCILLGLIIAATAGAPVAGAHGWKAPPEAVMAVNPVEKSERSLREGAGIYRRSCLGCHGSGGRGDGPAAKMLSPAPPDLMLRAREHTEGDLFWKISTGRGAMPAFEKSLERNQIWDVVNYIFDLAENP